MESDSETPSAERSAPRGDAEKATKDRLLEAAVRLFAERGFQGASVRAVTEAAGTSVSAANYHFGSKKALLRAAIMSRAAPLNERRLRALATVEREAGGRPPRVEAVVGAFVNPVLEMRAEAGGTEPAYRALAARLYVDPPEPVAEIRREVFEPVNERFREVLSRALPQASPAQVSLALQLALGVLVHMLSVPLRSGEEPGMALEELFRSLVAFSAAGIQAVCGQPNPGEPEARAPDGERS